MNQERVPSIPKTYSFDALPNPKWKGMKMENILLIFLSAVALSTTIKKFSYILRILQLKALLNVFKFLI
jgi:hypothetical protein